jgi:Ca2+-binding RTX toxin-like protein
MPYTRFNSSGGSASIASSTLGSVLLTRYDESGFATTNTINVNGYNVNNVTISGGTGANDSVVGSTGNDLFVWDDNTLPSGSRGTANGGSRNGWSTSSSNAHFEDWFGGAGNDIFNFTHVSGGTALAFATTVYGGTGNDVIWQGNTNDIAFGEDGLDTIYGGGGNDTAYGGASDDFIYGGGGNDTLDGGAGGDDFFGGAGTDAVAYFSSSSGVVVDLSNTANNTGDATGDTYNSIEIIGGSNFADTLVGSTSTDTLVGLGGNDVILAGGGNDLVTGDDGNDALQGGSGNDALYGGNDNDTLDGGAGSDALDGGTGTNYASYESATASVELDLANAANNLGDAAGDSYINIAGYIGSNFNDTMWGSSGGDLEYGGLGEDWLEGGGGGADTLYGGDGNDFLSGMYSTQGGGAPDTLYGEAGDDTMLFSNAGSAVPVTGTYYGWSGESGGVISLTLAGHQDTSDHLYGGDGHDTVDASLDTASTQQMYIRAGKDANLDWIMSAEYFIASNNADVVNLSYANSTGTTTVAITDDVTVTGLGGSDVIVSGSGHDVLVGGSMTAAAAASGTADTIWGGDGNDTIWGDDYDDTITGTGGEGGNDTLYGADGDDTVMSQGGSDLSYGGFGNDVIWSDQGDWGLTTSSVMGNDTVYGGDGDDYILDLGGRNSVGSSTSHDLIFGGIGNDVISVFAGNDTIDGGSGIDVIWGGAGNDTVYGGPGDDYIYGGSGVDVLEGGPGADWYYVSRDDGTTTINEISGEGAVNHLVIFGTWAYNADNSTPANWYVTGTGIHETDSGEWLSVGHVLGNHSDTAAQTGNVNIVYNSATSVTISVAGTSSAITFNPLMFADVTLWNHDVTGTQQQELYIWDPNARGAGQGGFEFNSYIG